MSRRTLSTFLILTAASLYETEPAEACTRPAGVSIGQVDPGGTLHVGDEITVHGSSFNTLSSAARLAFTGRGGSSIAPPRAEMQIISNSELRARVPADAITGEIRIIEAVQCNGPIANSSSIIVYTLGVGPVLDIDNKLPSPPFDRAGVAVSETQIDLTWIPGDATFRDGFKIFISEDFGRTWNLERSIFNNLADMASVVGLRPGTSYFFDIVGFGPHGQSVTDPQDIVKVTTFGPPPGTGHLTISDATGGALCNVTPTLNRVEAFFDDNMNQVVDGATGDSTRGAYPHSLAFVASSDPGQLPQRQIFESSSYGRGLAGNVLGNLVIAAYFSACGAQRFISVHLAVWQDNNGVHADGIAVLVGDRSTSVPSGEYGNGAILEGVNFDPNLDANAILRGRAIGSINNKAVRLVDLGTNQTFEAKVTFDYDVPVEMR